MMLIINWSGVHVLVSQRERERRFGHHGERNNKKQEVLRNKI